MALVSIRDLRLAFAGPPVLDGVSMQIEAGERVCLVGRNGEGKSSLMRIVTGDMKPDGGEVSIGKGVRVARLAQDVPQDITGSVFEVVASGIGQMGRALFEYRTAIAAVEHDPSAMKALETAQQSVDASGGWEAYRTVETVISRLKLEAGAEFSTLSGGMKRRVMLARALASDPDVLMLDEPTNHLDIDSITWLEEFLLRHVKTLFFVTHDRELLKKLATRIVELDRGHLADWRCDYDTYLKRKEELLHAEEKEWDRFNIKLAEEEQWLRKGVTARRRRNMGRLRDLKKMREVRQERRYRPGEAKMQLQEAGLSGKLVIEAQDLTVAFDEQKPVFSGFSAAIMRGDKVGIIGPNGAGKTTLLRAMLGKLEPTGGSVRHGTNLEVAYFDQLRDTLDMDALVYDVVGEGQEWVTIGENKRHVMGYLKDFLFTRERARTKVHALSGGERNRLLLAKLFTRPANVLVLDEPTNDLDAETLDLLEELLMDYTGTVLVVSHDRAFLNNVVTSSIVFDADGEVREYVGGYDDWLRQRPQQEEKSAAQEEQKQKRTRARADGKRKLTFNEKRERDQLQQELDAMPERIEALEQAQEDLNAKLADPDFYQRDPEGFARATEELQKQEAELDAALERWEAVEERLGELVED